jgi:hypothetical protein
MNQGFDDSKNVFTPYMHKRISFEHEREYRLLATCSGTGEPPPLLRESVDLNGVVDAIFASPKAPSWYQRALQRLVERYGFTWSVERSDLAGGPIL